MGKSNFPNDIYILNTTSSVGENLSTAVTGSTVLTAAVATAAELNATNTLVNQIKAILVSMNMCSS